MNRHFSPGQPGSDISRRAGLYIHVPFCRQKCRYCDFYSLADLSLIPSYKKALLTEIARVSGPFDGADTLYFGGGTPSLLSPGDITTIIDATAARFGLQSRAEITLEANPGTVTPESLKGFRDAGVNRINIGIQSFSDETLSFLGRIHTAKEAVSAVEQAAAAGFTNIGLDLIYGIPGRTLEDWRAELRRAAAFSPAHLSCYILTYEGRTPLARLLKAGEIVPASDETVRDQFLVTMDILADHGFVRYETSNFAQPGFQSRHNVKYWNFIPYAGFGPAAHSFHPWERSWNVSDVGKYCRELENGRLPVEERESLGKQERIIEAIYLGLRQTRGIGFKAFEAVTGERFEALFKEPLEALVKERLIDADPQGARLTRSGMAVQDAVAAHLVNTL